MLPITGPISEYTRHSVDDVGSYTKRVTRYRQKKPYDLPLPYSHEFRRTDSVRGSSFGGFANSDAGHSPKGYIAYTTIDTVPSIDTALVQIVNAARSKFTGELSEASEMLVNLAERKQAVQMMTLRLSQLYRFTKAIRHGDFVRAGKELGVLRDKRYHRLRGSGKLRSDAKSASNNWLEFHFGWSPLINDIHSSIKFLQEPIKSVSVVGRRALRDTSSSTYTGTYYSIRGKHVFKVSAHVQADIRITNPNLWLADRLGLINPLGLAWELIPFSFVIDWFVPVSDFLGQWTEFAGIEFINPMYSTHVEDLCTRTHLTRPNARGPYSVLQSEIVTSSHVTKRYKTIPSVTLATRVPWTLSVSRAATAIALLLQKGLKSIR